MSISVIFDFISRLFQLQTYLFSSVELYPTFLQKIKLFFWFSEIMLKIYALPLFYGVRFINVFRNTALT